MTTTASYGFFDRLTHRVAFSTPGFQRALAEIEGRLFAQQATLPPDRPVFVAGLPRSGTTLVLDLLHATGDFASHTYRHMPFVLCPLLWDRISRPLRKQAMARERPHGDGMIVSEDSPEAFEEVLWKAYFPEHYRQDRITLWRERPDPEFARAFREHAANLVALEAGKTGKPLRYLSKNNANIARLELLPSVFPDARIIVPFRNPRIQANSLARQHRRFVAVHEADPFALRYMNDLGHHEFGAGLKPFDFPDRPATDAPDFWLGYWRAAYAHVLRAAGTQATFLDYDRALTDPATAIRIIEAASGLPAGTMTHLTGRFRPAAGVGGENGDDVPERAHAVWDELRDVAAAQADTLLRQGA